MWWCSPQNGGGDFFSFWGAGGLVGVLLFAAEVLCAVEVKSRRTLEYIHT